MFNARPDIAGEDLLTLLEQLDPEAVRMLREQQTAQMIQQANSGYQGMQRRRLPRPNVETSETFKLE